jgi:hypothetical protein
VQSSAAQHCHRNSEVAAHDLLMPYGDVVMALSIVLRIKRTLDGVEIDTIISDVEARKALALERQRRADWRKRELAASRFRAKCDYLDGAVATSSPGQVPVIIRRL